MTETKTNFFKIKHETSSFHHQYIGDVVIRMLVGCVDVYYYFEDRTNSTQGAHVTLGTRDELDHIKINLFLILLVELFVTTLGIYSKDKI